MAELVDNSITLPVQTMVNGALFEAPRSQSAKNSSAGSFYQAQKQCQPDCSGLHFVFKALCFMESRRRTRRA